MKNDRLIHDRILRKLFFLTALFTIGLVLQVCWAGPVARAKCPTDISRQECLEQQFDIVETFDELQDWYGTSYDPGSSKGDIFADDFPDDFPKKTNGDTSMWCYYSKWSDHPASGEKYWIDDFGQGTHFGAEGKSALIDLSNIIGPSRIGFYFGNGESNSGYKDIYVFYMTKISRKQWPTRCEKSGNSVTCSAGGTGVYKDGKDYSYWGSWKFNTIGIGWNTCKEWKGSVPDHEHRYGSAEIIPHIKANNYGPIPRLDNKPEQKQNLIFVVHFNSHENGPTQSEASVSGEDIKITNITKEKISWDGKGGAIITDEWMGVEFHYTLEEPASSGGGKMEAWIYNEKGESLRAFYVEGVNYLPASENGHRFNRFFFGGNNSNSYTWGPTMEAPYYVDDLIISGNRIGPKYFELLGFDNARTLPQPQNLRIIETLKTSPNVQKP